MGELLLDHLVCFKPKDSPASAQESYRWRFLAQGDSWFLDAASALDAHTNLLRELVFKQAAMAVNCAAPSNGLSHLVDLEAAPDFVSLLTGADAPTWDALLLSVGGNDLIAAACTPSHRPGAESDAAGLYPLHLRLLRHQTEWGKPSAGVARYFSEPGWQTFADYLRKNLRHLLSLRDQGPSAGKPVFMHSYAVAMPRPAAGDGIGPWLYPTFKAHAIPSADWLAVSRLMTMHLALLLKELAADKEALPNLHVFDSTAVPLAVAGVGSTGISGDWHDEIHLNHSGCFKIARAWSEHIEAVLEGRPTEPPAPTKRRSRR